MAKYASSNEDSLSSDYSDQDELVKNDDWWTEECQEATRVMRRALRQLKRNKRSASLKQKYKKAKSARQRILRNTFEKWASSSPVRTKKDKKKLKKSKKSKSRAAELVDSGDELDLERKLHSMGHYLSDRATMLEQMFNIIKGEKLKAMLPPMLKELPLSELKSLCLVELVKLSSGQVRSVLAGQPCPSDDESHSSDSEREAAAKDQPDSTSVEPATHASSSSSATAAASASLKPEPKQAQSNQDDAVAVDAAGDASAMAGGEETDLTLMELLELEMRARAIKALLERDDEPEEGEEQDAESPPPPPPPPPPPADAAMPPSAVTTASTNASATSEADRSKMAAGKAKEKRSDNLATAGERSKSAAPPPQPPPPPILRTYRSRRKSSSRSASRSMSRSRSRSRSRKRGGSSSGSSRSRSRSRGKWRPLRRTSRSGSRSLSRSKSPGRSRSRSRGRRRDRQSSLSSISSRSLSGSRAGLRRRRRYASHSSLSSVSSRSRSRSRSRYGSRSRSRSRSRSGGRGEKRRAAPANLPEAKQRKKKPRPPAGELEEGEVSSEYEDASDPEREAEERRWQEYERSDVQLDFVADEKGVEGAGFAEQSVEDITTNDKSTESTLATEMSAEKKTKGAEQSGAVKTTDTVISVRPGRRDVEKAAAVLADQSEATSSKDSVDAYVAAKSVETCSEVSQSANIRTTRIAGVISSSTGKAAVSKLTVTVSKGAPKSPAFRGQSESGDVVMVSPPATPVSSDGDMPVFGFQLEQSGVFKALEGHDRDQSTGREEGDKSMATADPEVTKTEDPGQAVASPSCDTSPTRSPKGKKRLKRGRQKRGDAAETSPQPRDTTVSGHSSAWKRRKLDSSAAGETEVPEPVTQELEGTGKITGLQAKVEEKELHPALVSTPTKSPRKRASSAGGNDTTEVAPSRRSGRLRGRQTSGQGDSPAPSVTPGGKRHDTSASPGRATPKVTPPDPKTDSSCGKTTDSKCQKRVGSPAALTAAVSAVSTRTTRSSPRGSRPTVVKAEPAVRRRSARTAAAEEPEVAKETKVSPRTRRSAGRRRGAGREEEEAEVAKRNTEEDVGGGETGRAKQQSDEQHEAHAEVRGEEKVKPEELDAEPQTEPQTVSQSVEDTENNDELLTVAQGESQSERMTEPRPKPSDNSTNQLETPKSLDEHLRELKAKCRARLESQPKTPTQDIIEVVDQSSSVNTKTAVEERGKPSRNKKEAKMKKSWKLSVGTDSAKDSSDETPAPDSDKGSNAVAAAASHKPLVEAIESLPEERAGKHDEQTTEPIAKSSVESVQRQEGEPTSDPASDPPSSSPSSSAPAHASSSAAQQGLGYWRELAAEAQYRYLAEEAETERLTRQEETRLQELERRLADEEAGQTEESGMAGHTWAVRWLQSDKVQKVVNASKVYNRVKQKLKTMKRTAEPPPPPPEPKVKELPQVIGSIEEYERLFGKKVVASEPAPSQPPQQQQQGGLQAAVAVASNQPPPPPAAAPQEPSDDEDDALWGDILGDDG